MARFDSIRHLGLSRRSITMMATKQEGAASLLADTNDPSDVKDSQKIAVKPVESEETEKRAQKRKDHRHLPPT